MHQNQRTGRWSGLPSAREVLRALFWPLTALLVGAAVWAAIEAPFWWFAAYAAIVTIAVVGAITISERHWWWPLVVAFVVSHIPTKHQVRLWLRDHWKRFLVVLPLGLAGFLTWHFWPWGLIGSAIILFLTVTKVISWQRVRKGYGGMEFPGETVLRAERHHWLAFLVFGWEWGKQPKWEAPERGTGEVRTNFAVWLLTTIISILWRGFQDRRLWPIGYLIATAAAFFFGAHENLFGPEPEWWVHPVAGLVWLVGLTTSAIYWWDFWTFVWPGHYAVITDQNITMIRPARGPAGTVEPDSATVPLGKIGHWGTRRRALGGGDWDPSFVFGEERVVFRFLKDPEDFSRAAREQAQKFQAEARAQRR